MLAELTDAELIRKRFAELAGESRRRRVAASAVDGAPKRSKPLVSVVITYFELDAYVEEAVDSICSPRPIRSSRWWSSTTARSARRTRSFERIAERYPVTVVTQPNSGLPQARNFGISLTRGDYVLPFDADDVAEPELVERCVEALEADPEVVYVTPWSNFMLESGKLVVDAGYQPLGNRSTLVREQNVAGSSVSLFRRELFERGFEYDPEFASYEDWDLFRELHDAGLYGHALPQRLYRYRVRLRRCCARSATPRTSASARRWTPGSRSEQWTGSPVPARASVRAEAGFAPAPSAATGRSAARRVSALVEVR